MTQGITKAFDKMSQSEQVMLRYQYLMQATADAQGDFARTSDGYANSLRQLETNIEQLKTNVGGLLLPIVNEVINGINDMMGALTTKPSRTVMDDFADIDLKTAQKLTEIQDTADKAETLVTILEDLGQTHIAASGLTGFVDGLSGSISELDAAMTKAETGDYAGTIKEIAGAMAASTGTDASAWETLLTAIGGKLPSAVDATLDDDGQTAAFLKAAGDAAESLGGEYPALWKQLLGVLGDNAGAAITALANGATAAAALAGLANGANTLTVDVNKWKMLLNALSTGGNINLTGAGKSIGDFADALNGNDPGTDRATAWKELLGALSTDVEGLSNLTGTSAEETSAWLAELAEGANSLDPNSADGWDKLFGKLLNGLPGLTGTEGYDTLLASIAGEADDAETYLRALGYSTEDITNAQSQWLKVAQQLVKTIPGLSEVINTETGEVEGGIGSIREYVAEWQRGQEKILAWKAYYQKVDAANEKRAAEYSYRVDMLTAQQRAKMLRERFNELGGTDAFNSAWIFNAGTGDYGSSRGWGGPTKEDKELLNVYLELIQAETAATKAEEEYGKQAEANQAVVQDLQDAHDALIAEYGEEADAASEAAEAAVEWSETQQEAATNAVTATAEALQAVEDYYRRVREETMSSLGSVAHGFDEVVTPAQKARRELQDLSDELGRTSDADKRNDLNVTYSSIEATIPSIQNMTSALQSQLDYLNQYQTLMEQARANGVSDDILAFLADGSVESYDYLTALASGDKNSIEQLNSMYAEVQTQREALASSLTDTRLSADDEFNALVESAAAAAGDLNQYEIAQTAMEETVKGIADGIAAQVPAVQAQVDQINSILDTLGNVGGHIGSIFSGGRINFNLDGSHATGLDYVPFDNYLAQLHEGESILTAEEARVWRSFKNGGESSRNTIDYSALHGAIWDGAPSREGSVYLDGRIVGRVLNEQQANSLRALERSGWKQ